MVDLAPRSVLLAALLLFASCGANDAEMVAVSSPTSGAAVESPLVVRGDAPSVWYFEAIFDARIESPEGQLIAEAPARALGDWMAPGRIPFEARLSFQVDEPRPAVLVLTADSTGEPAPPPKEKRIPITLAP